MNNGHCFQCEAKNPPEQMFCGQCGSSLVLKDFISTQVSKGVSEVTRDREAPVASVAEKVFHDSTEAASLYNQHQ